MRSWNKRALELAASTIVTLIVAVTILTLSISLTYGVFCGAEDYARDVDGQSEQRIEQLLAGGGKVQVADNSKRAQREGSMICGQDPVATASFALGIKNTGTTEQTYNVTIERSEPAGTLQPNEAQVFEPLTIQPRQLATTRILITMPANVTQDRIYTVTVTNSTDHVYGVRQLYVEPEE